MYILTLNAVPQQDGKATQQRQKSLSLHCDDRGKPIHKEAKKKLKKKGKTSPKQNRCFRTKHQGEGDGGNFNSSLADFRKVPYVLCFVFTSSIIFGKSVRQQFNN